MKRKLLSILLAFMLAFTVASVIGCTESDSLSCNCGNDNSGGSTDGGSTGEGSTDGGSTGEGSTDGGSTDGGSTDGGSTDGGSTDGGSTENGNGDGTGDGVGPVAKEEIVVWASTYEFDFITDVVATYALENPSDKYDYKVEVCGEDVAYDKLKNDTEGSADLIPSNSAWIVDFSDLGLIKPLSNDSINYVKENNHDSVETMVTYNENIYGFPYSSITYFLYYNKNYVTEEQAKSYSGLVEAAANAPDSASVEYALAMNLYENGYFSMSPLYAAGAELFTNNDASKISFATDGVVEAFQFLQKEYMVEGGITEGDYYELLDHNRNETAAAVISGPWMYDSFFNVLGDDLGITKLPTMDFGSGEKQLMSMGTSYMYVINNIMSDEKAEETEKLARFLTSDTVQLERFKECATNPIHKDLENNEDITSNIIASTLYAQIPYTVSQPSIPQMGNFWSHHAIIGAIIKNESDVFCSAEKIMAKLEDFEAILRGE